MATGRSERILIIGAGMAGLTLARTLSDAGATVTVMEKSRGIGGRMASRRTDFGTFDHGAQYVTGKGAPFRALLTGLSHDGTVAFWKPTGKDRTVEWHVGVPAMNKMLTPMLGGFDIRLRTRVTSLARNGETLDVHLEMDEDEGPAQATDTFDRILSTVPAPQALELLGALGEPFERLGECSYEPCWTLMLAFDTRVATEHDVHRATPGDGSPIGWAARNGSKPERAGEHDLWLTNATGAWSREHLEDDRVEVIEALLPAFGERLGVDLPDPVHAVAHRWRYAAVERPLGEPYLLSHDGRIGAAGDWCLAPRVEAAFESARALADAVKERL